MEEVPKSGERPSLEDAEGSAKERLVTIEEEAAPSGASAPAAWKVMLKFRIPASPKPYKSLEAGLLKICLVYGYHLFKYMKLLENQTGQ